MKRTEIAKTTFPKNVIVLRQYLLHLQMRSVLLRKWLSKQVHVLEEECVKAKCAEPVQER